MWMNLFDLFVKVEMQDRASTQAAALAQKLGSGLRQAAAVGVAAVGTATAGYVALTKKAIENYAEYEQLIGGVETLFEESADAVIDNAERAYKTAGMSANAYMETVTSFAASLKQSLGGDAVAAAELADLALTDMSDNANKMGTDIGMLQNAYQGFAKQNYTMLDNLKLGYGGTQTEMKRLIREAAALDDSIDANSMSFANIVRAINVVQTEMGITGTTSKEASTTITGSVNAMKAAWENLTVGIADENSDIDQLVNDFAESVVTVGDNLIPRLEQVGESVIGLVRNYGRVAANTVKEKAPEFWSKVQTYVENEMPEDISAAKTFVAKFLDQSAEWVGNEENHEKILKLFTGIGNAFLSGDAGIDDAAKNLIVKYVSGLTNALSDEDVQASMAEFSGKLARKLFDLSGLAQLQDIVKNILEMLGKSFSSDGGETYGTKAYSNIENFFSGVKNFGKNFLNGWKGEEYTAPETATSGNTVTHNITYDINKTGDEDIDAIIEDAASRAASYIQDELEKMKSRGGKSVVYG